MAQFSPDILFTNPNMASQLVRLADLDAAQKNHQQAVAISAIAASAHRQALEREANQRNALQYAALMNQQQQHQNEMASRERMLQSQLGNQRELLNTQLDAQKELARLNPWGKGGVDAYLGGMQINNNIDQTNKEAEAEAAQLNAQLAIINQEHAGNVEAYNPNWITKLGRLGLGSGAGLIDTNDEARQEAIRNLNTNRNAKISNLLTLAKKSYYDPTTQSFRAIQRNQIGVPGQVVAVQPDQQPSPLPDTGGGYGGGGFAPPSGSLDLPGVGSGTIQRFTPVPWLDNPNPSNIGSAPASASDSLDQINSDYMNSTIDAPTAIARRRALGL